MITKAIDYKYLLLENYKKLKINETEVLVILMMDHLINQGNKLITPDLLALKMNLEEKEIDNILAKLTKKKLIDYVTKKNELITSLEPLQRLLLDEFEMDNHKQDDENSKKQTNKMIDNVFQQFECLMGRSLSPVEISKIKEWIEFGYSDEMIINALKDAINKGSKSLRMVDKILLNYERRDDIDTDGISPINKNWNKNLEDTIKIVKTPWLDDKDED